jgi:hypothetical protein
MSERRLRPLLPVPSILSAPLASFTRTCGALITSPVLSNAEASRAALAIVGALTACLDVLQFRQRMWHVDVLRSQKTVAILGPPVRRESACRCPPGPNLWAMRIPHIWLLLSVSQHKRRCLQLTVAPESCAAR